MDYSELVEFLNDKFKKIDERFDQLPTKAWVQDLIVSLRGDTDTKFQKEDIKVNRLSDMLHEKHLISDSERKELRDLNVFSNKN